MLCLSMRKIRSGDAAAGTTVVWPQTFHSFSCIIETVVQRKTAATTTTAAAVFYQAKKEFHSRRDPYGKPVALTLSFLCTRTVIGGDPIFTLRPVKGD